MGNISEVVKNLIIINVIFFLGSSLLMPSAIIPFDRDVLALHFFLSERFEPFQLVTYMFMHDNVRIGHILFNMIGLFFFGPPLENLWGPKRFLFFYLAAGLGSALIHMGASYYEYNQVIDYLIHHPDHLLPPEEAITQAPNFVAAMLGASGAVYAVFVGFAILFPKEKVMLLIPPIPMRASVLVLLMIGYDLYSGLSGSGTGIAHFAHLGGAFFGAMMVWYWKSRGRGYS